MHAEEMTKLVTVASGEVFAAFVDLRPLSSTTAVVELVRVVPGVQVLVPPGVANGFQGISETSQYVYCFDHEWAPGMPGWSITQLDEQLAIPWPITVDCDDPAQISAKDRSAVPMQDLHASETTS